MWFNKGIKNSSFSVDKKRYILERTLSFLCALEHTWQTWPLNKNTKTWLSSCHCMKLLWKINYVVVLILKKHHWVDQYLTVLYVWNFCFQKSSTLVLTTRIKCSEEGLIFILMNENWFKSLKPCPEKGCSCQVTQGFIKKQVQWIHISPLTLQWMSFTWHFWKMDICK